jgi:hypothetical protein
MAKRAVDEAVGGSGRTDVVVIERQHHMNRRASMIEAALRALYAASPSDVPPRVVEAPPKRVAEDFCLRIGYREKKIDAVRIVDAMISDTSITRVARSSALDQYVSSKKRDDMADAALMLYWHARRAREFVARTGRCFSTRLRGTSAKKWEAVAADKKKKKKRASFRASAASKSGFKRRSSLSFTRKRRSSGFFKRAAFWAKRR